MKNLKIPISTPIRLYSDSKSAINIVNNSMQHDLMKHIRINRHFIKQQIKNGGISLSYIPIKSQEANILTKAMLRQGSE